MRISGYMRELKLCVRSLTLSLTLGRGCRGCSSISSELESVGLNRRVACFERRPGESMGSSPGEHGRSSRNRPDQIGLSGGH